MGISDIASSLFISSYSLGCILGPTIGGNVYDAINNKTNNPRYSFKWTSLSVGIFLFSFGILYGFIVSMKPPKKRSS